MATTDISTPTTAELAPLRPPATPLVTCDPYFSIWSFSNELSQEHTKHWTGVVQSLGSLIRVDGVTYRLMGPEPAGPALTQVSLEVLPTRTIYQFAGAGVQVTLTFLTPALPHDLEKLSWPVAYITWDVKSTDGQEHEVTLYFDASAPITTNTQDEPVTWGRLRLDEHDVLFTGSLEQPVLAKSGDNLRIDWGYLYGIATDPGAVGLFSRTRDTRRKFGATGELPTGDPFTMPQPARLMGLVWLMPLGKVGAVSVRRTVILAYDDRLSIEYLHRRLQPYWRRLGWNADDLLRAAIKEQETLTAQCTAYDSELMQDMTALGGLKYARLCALSFRQCLAAHKLAADFDGTPLFFSKENFSNGCIATVDVTYPAAPFYLLFNPELLKGTLKPIFEYASLPRWRFPFAPHDIGTYPLANGQVYGGGERTEENQMPVEECGNMLILAAALAVATNDTTFLQPYQALLRQWAEYLKDKGFDPDNQLCTDDFAGHLAHNTNLSIKAILGLASYARVCEMLHQSAEAAEYRQIAERFAAMWEQQANDGDHYKLTFDTTGTWSQKYNLVWDILLELHTFDPQIAHKETEFYKTKQNEFGLPLDSRKTWTKLDWILWTATMADSESDFQSFVEPVYEFAHRSPSRVPLTDWYFTDNGRQRGFQARSVVGGVFIKALRDKGLWQKWMAKAK